MSTVPYDYTAEDTYNPAEDGEDYVIGGGNAVVAVPDRSADAIEKDNTYPVIPPGPHTLVIKRIVGQPHVQFQKVWMPDGSMSGYTGVNVTVEFMLPNNPKMTVRDTFTVPPVAPHEHAAYFDGKIKPDDERGGFFANKFLHFISRIGFDFPPGGQLPPQALALKNWKGRAVHAVVTPPKPYTDKKTGQRKDGFPNIKLFSYRPINAPMNVATGDAGQQPASEPQAAPRAANPAPRPAAAVASSGLDDI